MKTCFALLLAAFVSAIAEVPSKELLPLENYAGKWTGSLTGNSEARSSQTGQWTLDGHFLEVNWVLEPEPDGTSKLTGKTIMTFDVAKGVYRSWQYFSTGLFITAEGTWNKASRTFTWTAKNPENGDTIVTKAAFPTESAESWSIVGKDASGNETLSLSGNNAREKAK